MMTRTATFLAIAVVSSVATPLVVRAAGPVSAPTQMAAVSTVATTAPATVTGAAVTQSTESTSAAPCMRRVRVVYQGFGPAPDACSAR